MRFNIANLPIYNSKLLAHIFAGKAIEGIDYIVIDGKTYWRQWNILNPLPSTPSIVPKHGIEIKKETK